MEIKKKFNWLKMFALMIVFIILAIILFGCWIYSDDYVSTDDGYINANVVQISPQITGQVVTVDINNNQSVKKGEILFRLDPTPFVIKVNQAKARLTMDQANLNNAKVTAKRVFILTNQGTLSQQAHDDALEKVDIATAQVNLDQASLQTAQLNLQYTQITAPADGWVSNMTLCPKDTVQANEPQFALILKDQFWVDANFKETDLRKIALDAAATIYIDMYPHHAFHGVVASISHASGNTFALLPAENATGNWVKITQRVPVKILITDINPNYPLRVGTSASVTIHLSR